MHPPSRFLPAIETKAVSALWSTVLLVAFYTMIRDSSVVAESSAFFYLFIDVKSTYRMGCLRKLISRQAIPRFLPERKRLHVAYTFGICRITGKMTLKEGLIRMSILVLLDLESFVIYFLAFYEAFFFVLFLFSLLLLLGLCPGRTRYVRVQDPDIRDALLVNHINQTKIGWVSSLALWPHE